jgi:hypothetical protein
VTTFTFAFVVVIVVVALDNAALLILISWKGWRGKAFRALPLDLATASGFATDDSHNK